MGTFAPWYKFTPFQIEVINAWERGDVAALARLSDYRRHAVGV